MSRLVSLNRRMSLFAAVGVTIMLSGCVSTKSSIFNGNLFSKHKTPSRMVLVMTPSQTEDFNQHTHQGVMCRTYFFVGKDPHPVKVDGNLVFTAFDRSKAANGDYPPDGLYSIDAEQLPRHLRKDIVGDSYLFWLPFQPENPTQLLVQAELTTAAGKKVNSGIVSVEMQPAHSTAIVDNGRQRPKPYYRTRQEVVKNSNPPPQAAKKELTMAKAKQATQHFVKPKSFEIKSN